MRRVVLAVILLAVIAFPASAQPGTPVKSGQASFTLGTAALTYTFATGNISESYGFKVASVTFADKAKPNGDHITISAMIKGPGPVDLNQPMGNGIGYWKSGTIFQYTKGESQCTLTVTNITADLIEGTANCPVLNQMDGSATLSLTNVKFSATTK